METHITVIGAGFCGTALVRALAQTADRHMQNCAPEHALCRTAQTCGAMRSAARGIELGWVMVIVPDNLMSRALDSLLCLEFALPRLAPAVFAAALCACAVPAMASTSLNSRADVIAALDAGYDVSLTTDLSRCTPEQGTPASQTRGGGHIDAYRITEDGTVAFSGSHFTVASNDKVRKQSRLRTYPHPPLRGTFSRREKGRLFAVQGSARGRSPSPAGEG